MPNDTNSSPSQVRANRHAALDEWLDKYNARCLWSKTVVPKHGIDIECYRVGTSLVLVMRYHDGWDLFTASQSNKIDETLADAERRIAAGEAESL
jgi:hypothetical protein